MKSSEDRSLESSFKELNGIKLLEEQKLWREINRSIRKEERRQKLYKYRHYAVIAAILVLLPFCIRLGMFQPNTAYESGVSINKDKLEKYFNESSFNYNIPYPPDWEMIDSSKGQIFNIGDLKVKSMVESGTVSVLFDGEWKQYKTRYKGLFLSHPALSQDQSLLALGYNSPSQTILMIDTNTKEMTEVKEASQLLIPVHRELADMIYFIKGTYGSQHIVAMNTKTKQQKKLTEEFEQIYSIRFSKDNKNIIYLRQDEGVHSYSLNSLEAASGESIKVVDLTLEELKYIYQNRVAFFRFPAAFRF